MALALSAAVAAQSDPAATPPPAAAEAPPKINLTVSVPRNEPSKAQAEQCRRDSDAGTISGEIVVCAETGDDGSALTGNRDETRKRYAQETMLKGGPRAPDFIKDCKEQGNPFGCIGIANGLAPLGQGEELSEEQERARREAEGISTTVPPRPASKKKKGG